LRLRDRMNLRACPPIGPHRRLAVRSALPLRKYIITTCLRDSVDASLNFRHPVRVMSASAHPNKVAGRLASHAANSSTRDSIPSYHIHSSLNFDILILLYLDSRIVDQPPLMLLVCCLLFVMMLLHGCCLTWQRGRPIIDSGGFHCQPSYRRHGRLPTRPSESRHF
jgi:hypothetical protein